MKICGNSRCRTTSTPLFRRGWKKSDGSFEHLCNACGLAFAKGHCCPYPWCYQVYKETKNWNDEEAWISCDNCSRWSHVSCVKIAEQCPDYDDVTPDVLAAVVVTEEEVDERAKGSYVCPRCSDEGSLKTKLTKVTKQQITKMKKKKNSSSKKSTAANVQTTTLTTEHQVKTRGAESRMIKRKNSVTSIAVRGKLMAIVHTTELEFSPKVEKRKQEDSFYVDSSYQTQQHQPQLKRSRFSLDELIASKHNYNTTAVQNHTLDWTEKNKNAATIPQPSFTELAINNNNNDSTYSSNRDTCYSDRLAALLAVCEMELQAAM